MMKPFETVEVAEETARSDEGQMALSEARAQLPTLVNEAAEHGRRVVITKFSRPCAALVPIYDLERLLRIDAEAQRNLRVAETATESSEMIHIGNETAMARYFSDSSERDNYWRLGARVAELLSDPEVDRLVQSLKQDQSNRAPASAPALETTAAADVATASAAAADAER